MQLPPLGRGIICVVSLFLAGCARHSARREAPADLPPAVLAEIAGTIRHQANATMDPPSVVFLSVGAGRLHEVRGLLAADLRSAAFRSHPLPLGRYRVLVSAPRLASREKIVEVTAYDSPFPLEFVMDDSPAYKRELASEHTRKGLKLLARKKFSLAGAEFEKAQARDPLFGAAAEAKRNLEEAVAREHYRQGRQFEKQGRLANAYRHYARIDRPYRDSPARKDEIRKKIAQRVRMVISLSDFRDIPQALGAGSHIHRALRVHLEQGRVPGMALTKGSARSVSKLRSIGADALLAAQVRSFVVKLKQRALEKPGVGGGSFEELPEQEGKDDERQAAPGVEKTATLTVSYRLIAAGGSLAVGEGELSGEARHEGLPESNSYADVPGLGGRVKSDAQLGRECADQLAEKFVARLSEFVKARAELFLKKAGELKAAGDAQGAMEEYANARILGGLAPRE